VASTASESRASTAPSASGFFDYSAKEAFVVGAVTAIVQFCTAFAYGGVGASDFAIFQRSTTRFLDGVRMYSSAEVDFTPPLFHTLLLPFAHLNTTLAFCLWTAANVCLAAVLVRTVLRAVPAAWPKRWVVAAVVINAAGVQMTLRLGQVSWIVALLVTHAWLAGRSSRPYASGILAGVAVALKPFLVVALPVFLVRRQWTRLAATVVSMAVCGALGLLLFGTDASIDWLANLQLRPDPVYATHFLNASWGALAARAHVPILAATVMSVVTCLVMLAFAASSDEDEAWLLLLVTAIVASPVGWAYYVPILLGPVVSLVTRRGAALPRWVAWTFFVPALRSTQFQQGSLMLAATIGSVYLWGFVGLFVWVASGTPLGRLLVSERWVRRSGVGARAALSRV
jgi:hypothetical protein